MKKSMPRPISILLDDFTSENLMVHHEPDKSHIRKYPEYFFRLFFRMAKDLGIKGKISVTPQAAGSHWTVDFINEVRSIDLDRFELSLEGLTHTDALDLNSGTWLPYNEDRFFNRSSEEDMERYLEHALNICRDRYKINPTCITSPWGSGAKNREAYERAVMTALKSDSSNKTPWYFLDVCDKMSRLTPTISVHLKKQELGRLVHVPATILDYWWEIPFGHDSVSGACSKAIDRLHKLIKKSKDQAPIITILTHWQSLFSNGTYEGLESFTEFLEEVGRLVLDGALVWTKVSDFLVDYER